MYSVFEPSRWPNLNIPDLDGACGYTAFTPAELDRRHAAVRRALDEVGADALLVQNDFPPATTGCNPKCAWLSGTTKYRNTVSLLLRREEGPLGVFHGGKTSSCPGCTDPYLLRDGPKLLEALSGVGRLAYGNGLGLITYSFYQTLMERCPGLELVEFSNELEHLISIKSPEEIEAVRNTCAIQDRIFQAASTFLYPGRTGIEILADLTRLLMLLGSDPTLTPKVILTLGKNRPLSDGWREWVLNDRNYRIERDDYISLVLETPGCGGYYAERERRYFFQRPHPDHQAAHDAALALHRFQMSRLRPNVSLAQFRAEVNEYKAAAGLPPSAPGVPFGTELRGMGLLTVDRPQIECAWEDMPLLEGHVVTSMSTVRPPVHAPCMIFEMAVIAQEGAYTPSELPLDLIVL